MKSFVIGQPNEVDLALDAAHTAGLSPDVLKPVARHDAVRMLAFYGLRWSWPWEKPARINGLICHPYSGRDPRARISCFLSHYQLWRYCAMLGEDFIVLESDALFIRDWDPDYPLGAFGMVSLNDPRGATRLAGTYDKFLQRAKPQTVIEVPWVDVAEIPQGLPGHSAYFLRPAFAAELVDMVFILGAGPNDAIANRQWNPGKLGASTTYFTRVSGRPSMLA